MVEAAPALLHLAQFAPLVGAAFRLQPTDGPALTALLVEAQAHGAPSLRGRAPFWLVFEVPGGDVLPQGMQKLQHPDLGVLDLFLVPVGRSAGGVHYQAVFN